MKRMCRKFHIVINSLFSSNPSNIHVHVPGCVIYQMLIFYFGSLITSINRTIIFKVVISYCKRNWTRMTVNLLSHLQFVKGMETTCCPSGCPTSDLPGVSLTHTAGQWMAGRHWRGSALPQGWPVCWWWDRFLDGTPRTVADWVGPCLELC